MKDFQYYKNWAINHLKKQLAEENAVKKSLIFCELMLEKSFPVGTIREWKGKKYKKVAPGKWMRYYDKSGKGSQIALRNCIKEIENLKEGDFEGLLQIILKNKSRFVNNYNFPLQEVIEISKIAANKQADWNGEHKLLEDNIEEILSADTEEKRDKFKKTKFVVADTPDELKKVGLTGNQFVVSYGVISHHKNKDKDHDLNSDDWKAICDSISKPLLIVSYKDDYNMYLSVKKNNKNILVGVKVKKEGRYIIINDVTTAFAKKEFGDILKNADSNIILYEDTKKITALGYGTRNPSQNNSVTALHKIDGESNGSNLANPVSQTELRNSDTPNNSNLTSETEVVKKKTVEIKLSDFPPQFSKGKWKKQTQLFMDCVNKQTQANPVIKNVLSKLGKVFNSELPFSIRNVVKKFRYLECFAVEVINDEEPVGQLLYFTPNFEVEDTVKGKSMILVHELTHMIDFSLREDKKKESFMGEQKEKLLNSVLNAKISDYELEFLKEEVKRKNEERKVYIDDMIRLNNKLKELGKKYRKKEIDYETYDTEYDEIAKKYEEVKKQRDKFDSDHKALAQFCDIYDAISGGELYENENFPGHGKEYYSKKNKRVREILANIGSIGIFEPQYLNLLEKYQPEMMKEIYNYFNKIGE